MSDQKKNLVSTRSAQWSRGLVWANVVALLAVAVFFRAWRLDHVPGVNGDEAWLGVQAQRWLDGDLQTLSTPTGNPINVFHFGPQVLLHAFWAPSIGLLRLPVLISGLLALGVNFWLCQYAFGRRAAVWSTVILAIMPINIAYSRFAWDASQTVLFTLPVIYLSVLAVQDRGRSTRWLAGSALVLLCALVVHPTNIFLAPFPAIAFLLVVHPFIAHGLSAARYRWSWRVIWLTVALATVGVLAAIWPWLRLAARRALSLPEYQLFLQNSLDLFAGTTVYRFISGAPGGTEAVWSILFRLFAVGVILIAAYGLWRGGDQSGKRLIVGGGLASLCCFFLFAGPSAIAAGNERYAICLVAPVALLVALGLEWWSIRRPGTASLVGVAAGWLLLIGFYANYFQYVGHTGGDAHVAFRTSSIDPKQSVAYYLQHTAGQRGPVIAVATEWWSYWPLAYLTHHQPQVKVVGSSAGDAAFGQPRDLPEDVPYLAEDALRLNRNKAEVCFVEFTGTGRATEIERRLAGEGLNSRIAHVFDGSQRPVITIVWPQ